ncbi:IlvD/Edd family dehydratase [Cryobacterium tepidiphilum]|uniref:Dihydroxy-acid dehydratase n=1 Tax=Cryobacterium tepidiphilum TaxID=2486026 RepID=A0A3M8LMT8_9MICO|nr:IlvD/Edd family dehydratase [Cryobacterium tepidiphilum]RNE66701.1 dihydroxy-acid dehydratase [Cryobacterium tepidiphilum]
MSGAAEERRRLRSEIWFNDLDEPAETAVYLERFANYGITRGELQSGRPIIGIAQTGSDVVPCNRHHIALAERVKAGIRDAGGIPLEFPVHPLQETVRRPTAALDRNLAYLGLVEVMAGYPFDGVVLTTGCDKTTPACLMAAATVNIPSIVLSGGPMLNGYLDGKRAGSGMVLWEARRKLAAGEITEAELVDQVFNATPSAGHCNTMGTALSMNSLAEAMGMSLPGCAAIPAPYAERAAMAYKTGLRIVGMVHEDLTPGRIMTRAAFENAIVVSSAIGGSTNAPPHINAIAAHMGVELDIADWDRIGHGIGLLANVQPSGEYLGEEFHRAGGVPAIMGELLAAGRLHGDALTVTGDTIEASYGTSASRDRDVIRSVDDPLMADAGFMVLSGNLFSSAIIKTSVISEDFRARFLGDDGRFTVRAIVFDGPEDYRARIEDPDLGITEDCMLVVRGAGPIGYPGSAEVVNMHPPGYLIQQGVRMLPCLGDGRQSGTSDNPSILNVTPESAAGGNIAIVETGDRITVDLVNRSVQLEVDDEEIERRWGDLRQTIPVSNSPWEELYRAHVTQLADGMTLGFAEKYHDVGRVKPRHSH